MKKAQTENDIIFTVVHEQIWICYKFFKYFTRRPKPPIKISLLVVNNENQNIKILLTQMFLMEN